MSNVKVKEVFQLRRKNEFCRLNTSTGYGPMVPEPWVRMRPEKGCSFCNCSYFYFILVFLRWPQQLLTLSMLSLFFLKNKINLRGNCGSCHLFCQPQSHIYRRHLKRKFVLLRMTYKIIVSKMTLCRRNFQPPFLNVYLTFTSTYLQFVVPSRKIKYK